MKLRSLLSLAAVSLLAPAASAQITVEITEVPYSRPYAFLGLHFETGGAQNVIRASDKAEIAVPQTGFGIRMTGARETNVQLEMSINFRKLDLSAITPNAQNMGLGSFHIGGRLFPRHPIFGIGRSIAVRPTGAALGGYAFDFSDSTVNAGDSGAAKGLDVQVSAGLAFSGRTDPSGLTAEAVYRPTQLTGQRFSVKSGWSIRIGFQFSPG
jgi:hypothetical protein